MIFLNGSNSWFPTLAKSKLSEGERKKAKLRLRICFRVEKMLIKKISIFDKEHYMKLCGSNSKVTSQ